MNRIDIWNKIKEYGTVSFDVFDTLLLRPYVKPTDMFQHMEIHFSKLGFAKERIRAERVARSKEFEEVTLDEIYNEIDDNFKDLKESELSFEKQILQPNPEMRSVFNRVKDSGKRIILLSDMYLSSQSISEILTKNGYDGYEKLYMSCEYRKSKHYGELFSHVIDEMNIDVKDFVHIGDNYVSDVRAPLSIGIKAVKYSKVIDRYFKSHNREYKYYKRKKNLERSMIVAMDAIHWINAPDKNNFWYEFGYRYGGPVNAAFATFIEENAEKDGVLLFIARDGYNSQKAYRILYGDIANHYVYAMRTFNILFGINGRDYPGYEEDIVNYFADDLRVKELTGTLKDKFFKNKNLFNDLMTIELEKYSIYIKNYIGSKDNVYVVDATTEKFSSQKLINQALEKKTQGIYFTLLRSKSDYDKIGFHDNHRVFLELTSIDLPEFLMTSNENPVDRMDISGEPVYSEKDNPEEWYRREVSSDITKGVEDYSRTLKLIFEEYIPSFEYNTIGKWIRSFTRHMDSQECFNLKNVKWASDPAHSEYHGLIFSASDAPMLFRYKLRDYYRSLMRRIRNV